MNNIVAGFIRALDTKRSKLSCLFPLDVISPPSWRIALWTWAVAEAYLLSTWMLIFFVAPSPKVLVRAITSALYVECQGVEVLPG